MAKGFNVLEAVSFMGALISIWSFVAPALFTVKNTTLEIATGIPGVGSIWLGGLITLVTGFLIFLVLRKRKIIKF